MTSEIERRISGLLSTWDPASPFGASLKLVLDDVKRLEKPGPLRFSYTTSRCGLPPTNVNGRCRKYVEPKKIYAFGRQTEGNSLNDKETYDGLMSPITSLKTKLDACISVTERDAMKEEVSGPKNSIACGESNTDNLKTNSLKTKLDACISVTRMDALTEEVSGPENLVACGKSYTNKLKASSLKTKLDTYQGCP